MSDTGRIGDWMQTANGRKFWPLDPRPDEVHIDDIAHALSNVCRFGGHCRTFYSVAEHCVRVSILCEESGCALSGLLHDASEAYLGDIIRPLKTQATMASYRVAEKSVEQAILTRFHLARVSFALPAVKHADEVLLATEARDIMGGESAGKWSLRAKPLDSVIEPWSPEIARGAFLGRFAHLTA